MIDSISGLRTAGARLITGGGWAVTGLILIASVQMGQSAIHAALLSALLNVPTTISIVRGDTRGRTRTMIGVVAAIQPALLSFVMLGTPWHAEIHMLFFVALVTLILLCDHRPILFASAFIILHDFVLAMELLGIADGAGETALSAGVDTAAVVAISAVLCTITLGLGRVMVGVDHSRRTSQQQAELLEEQAGELQQALHRVEIERQAREKAEREKAEQRKADLTRFAREFENSIANVIYSVASTAQMLERTTKELELVAHETGDRASEVATSAQRANTMAHTVARGVAELSSSITNIAANASQQKELTTLANERSAFGGKAVGALSGQSETIHEATRSIVRIAERTNLLSLNAAIEAATAGPAGRGFTVVAQEVKQLAMQAGEAAIEIEQFLSGVQSGTIEAERSFSEIETAMDDLDKSAKAIRSDVEDQRKSADTITDYARNAAGEVEGMAERSRSLAESAETTKRLSSELDNAADALLENVRNLQGTTERFISNLDAA